MDRRTALAIALMLVIAVLPGLLFGPRTPSPPAGLPAADTAEAPEPGAQPTPPVPTTVRPPPEQPPLQADSQADAAVDERIVVESPLYRYEFSTRGARIAAAALSEYRTFAPGDSGTAQILPPESRFLTYGLVVGSDTVWMRDWAFEPSRRSVEVAGEPAELAWIATRGPLTVRVRQTFYPDRYGFDVEGAIEGVSTGLLLIGLGPRLALVEADSTEDIRAYGVVTKAAKTDNLAFRSLDPGEQRELAGPFEWVAVKSKYFVQGVLTVAEGQPRVGGARVEGGPTAGKHKIRANVVASLPAAGGRFSHSVYLGPQEFRRLSRIGHDLEDVNPYGWILRPIIRPFTDLIVRILLWMHDTLNLGYGWVLILFGIAVRVLLWPLNQKAMRSSMAMQAVQPELKAVQERYKQDPQRLQQEVMKLYKEHGVNPLGGCLPMLIPMPVLFALFFVFRETIEFRGVPFLWLPDLSRHDPLYVIPIVMGLSMFAVMKLGQRGVPPNPQAKMMLYLMPGMLTFLFLRFSAGLNLYYAVSNIASIPQQWLISRERSRRQQQPQPPKEQAPTPRAGRPKGR